MPPGLWFLSSRFGPRRARCHPPAPDDAHALLIQHAARSNTEERFRPIVRQGWAEGLVALFSMIRVHRFRYSVLRCSETSASGQWSFMMVAVIEFTITNW